MEEARNAVDGRGRKTLPGSWGWLAPSSWPGPLFRTKRPGSRRSATGSLEISHVLRALGHSRELAAGSIRLSLGLGTTELEIETVVGLMAGIVQRLRAGRSIESTPATSAAR